jgi:hypothetical protein
VGAGAAAPPSPRHAGGVWADTAAAQLGLAGRDDTPDGATRAGEASSPAEDEAAARRVAAARRACAPWVDVGGGVRGLAVGGGAAAAGCPGWPSPGGATLPPIARLSNITR